MSGRIEKYSEIINIPELKHSVWTHFRRRSEFPKLNKELQKVYDAKYYKPISYIK